MWSKLPASFYVKKNRLNTQSYTHFLYKAVKFSLFSKRGERTMGVAAEIRKKNIITSSIILTLRLNQRGWNATFKILRSITCDGHDIGISFYHLFPRLLIDPCLWWLRKIAESSLCEDDLEMTSDRVCSATQPHLSSWVRCKNNNIT